MKNTLKIELKKAFQNKLFGVTITIASVIAVFSAIYNIQVIEAEKEYYANAVAQFGSESVNPNSPLYSLFNHWICEDFSSLASTAFFMLFPIFAVLGYGWSLFSEQKSGYIKNVVTRVSKRKYFLSKYIATFLSGGAIVSIPVILNFLLVSMFVPAVKPDIFYNVGWTVGTNSMFSKYFYTQPFVYVFLRILVVFLFSGAVATVSYALAFFIRNRFAVILLPFLGVLALHFGQYLFEGVSSELSPIYLLGGYGFNTKMLWAVLLELGIMLIPTFMLALLKGGKDDVF